MSAKVIESAATTGNISPTTQYEVTFPVIPATNVGLSRQPAQVAPPQLQGGGRAGGGMRGGSSDGNVAAAFEGYGRVT